MATSSLRQLVAILWCPVAFVLLFLYQLFTDPVGLVRWLLWMPFVLGIVYLFGRLNRRA